MQNTLPRSRRDDSGYFDPFYLLVAGVALILLAVVGFIGFKVVNATHVEHRTCTVTDKDRAKGDGKSDARVYTEDCGVLSVSDSLFSWHWSSGDVYASIEVGETYEFKTRGWRVPFFSMFPNVVEAEQVAR